MKKEERIKPVMIKKYGELTIREMQSVCDTQPNCDDCPFNVIETLCDVASKRSVKEFLDYSVHIDNDFYEASEKNDSSANLEARIEKLETAVNELMGGVFKQ